MSEKTVSLEKQFDKEAREGNGCAALETLNEILRTSLTATTIDSQIEMLRQQAKTINDGDKSLPQVNVVSSHPRNQQGEADLSKTFVQLQFSQDKAHFPQILINETLSETSRQTIGSPECHNAKFKK
jgi:hypothetical protein